MNSKFSYISAALVLMVLGQEVLLSLPMLLASVAGALDLGEEQVGILASVELSSSAVAALVITISLNRINMRTLAFIGVGGLVAGNFLSQFAETFEVYSAMRVISGLSAGVIVTLGIAHLGKAENPDRNFGLFNMGAMLVQAAAVLGLPGINEQWGLDGVLLVLTVIPLTILPAILGLPKTMQDGDRTADEQPESGHAKSLPLAVLALASSGSFFLLLGAFWAYVERYGNNISLSLDQVGLVLFVSLIIGFFASLIPVILSDRYGHLLPLTCGFIMMIIGLITLQYSQDMMSYSIGVGLISFVWAMNMVYLMGLVTILDPTGKLVAMIIPVQAGGLGVGPLLGAAAFSASGFAGITMLSLVLLALCHALIIVVLRRMGMTALGDRKPAAPSADL